MCKQLGAFLTWRENPSPALNASQACIYLPCHLPSMSLVCGTRPFPKELTARAVWSRGRRAFNQFTDQKPDQFDAWFTQAGTGVPGGGTLAMANPQPPAQALPPPPWAESCQLELDESWSSSTRSSTAWNPENAGKKKKNTVQSPEHAAWDHVHKSSFRLESTVTPKAIMQLLSWLWPQVSPLSCFIKFLGQGKQLRFLPRDDQNTQVTTRKRNLGGEGAFKGKCF